MKRKFGLIYAVLCLAFLLDQGATFYEGATFVSYVQSMIRDFDFNIIDQVSDKMGWLVTQTYFHPDYHSETQSPLLLAFHALERLVLLDGFTAAGFAMSLFSLLLTFQITGRICEELGFRARPSDYAFFYFGCAIFYFSFFKSTVLEVTALPLVSYLVLTLVRVRAGEAPFSPMTAGICAGFLLAAKTIYWPLVLYVGWVASRELFKRQGWKGIAALLVPAALIMGCHEVNWFLKYGGTMDRLEAHRLILDFSPLNAWAKLSSGLFGAGGHFIVNPVFLISALGLFFLARERRAGSLSRPDAVFLFGWATLGLFQGFFLIGSLLEDHLPGRLSLAVAPVLFMGLVFLRTRLRERGFSAFGWILGAFCCWHLFLLGGFLLLDNLGAYLYPRFVMPMGEFWERALLVQGWQLTANLVRFKESFFYLACFASILAAIWNGAARSANPGLVVRGLAAACGLAFVAMTLLNLTHHSKNIESLKTRGFFAGKVVGSGSHLFSVDYIFDFLKATRMQGDERVNRKLDSIVVAYYDSMRAQVIQSTPRFDQAVAARSPDFSFWILQDNERGR